ncbi:hypothetical protein [Acetobacterium malicum]|uniref:hypothetical protein n=1 Tax=Acetobacterium malicum TaxID=52692 RepID=UPI003592F91A
MDYSNYTREQLIEIIDELKMLNNESAGLVCERISSRIEAFHFADGVKITISGGVAEYQGEVVPAFIDSADKNRYEAKNSGRNGLRLNKTLHHRFGFSL